MMLNNEAVYPASLFTKRASEGGRVGERAKEMPHGEQCELLFPGNSHKQEQRLRANQASESGLASFWTPRLIIIWLFTSTTPIGFIKGGGGWAEAGS